MGSAGIWSWPDQSRLPSGEIAELAGSGLRPDPAGLLLVVVSSLISLVLLEAGLRLATPFPITEETNRVDDPRLGYVLDPSYPGVDQHGFRNAPGALEAADLIFIGDSQTFGYNVHAAQSFPAVVARRTGRPAYNFGVGGYGIYQYAVLLEDAARLPVRDVVLGMYLANDLSYACRALRTDYWHNRAGDSGLALPYCGRGPTAKMRDRIYLAVKQTATLQALNQVVDQELFITRASHLLLEDHQHVNRARAVGHSKATSLSDPDIRRSFDHARRFLEEAQARFVERHIGFGVLLIPSKERVLEAWTRRRGTARDPELSDMVANEITLTGVFEGFLDQSGIIWQDALPFVVDGLERAIDQDEPFYKPNDGHPLERGYESYADAAIGLLARLDR
jgi:hypothetical protein